VGIFGYSREFKGDRQVGSLGKSRRLFGSVQVYWTVFFCTLVLDVLSKWAVAQTMVLHQSVPMVGTFFKLTYVRNAGAAFSLLADDTGPGKMVLLISIAAAAIIIFTIMAYRGKRRGRILMVALGLASGGASGNLINRAFSGTVVDFIEFSYKKLHWPVFNLADAAVVIGIFLLLLITFSRRLGR